MIPAAFEYYRPRDVSSAVSLLDQFGDEARVIAGGHSLIPMMKLRMADVPHLVDLQDLDELSGIEVGDTIKIGAMTTQYEMINDDDLADVAPILREAALQIADPQVRYMGTIGGNVANGDPGNDLPGLMQCLDAVYSVVSSDGKRTIPAREFYKAAFSTARKDTEILTSVSFRAPKGGCAYVKQKRKIGDYATAAAAVQIERQGDRCTAASIAMTNLSDIPVWSEAAASALLDTGVDEGAVKSAVSGMLGDIDPAEDNRGPVAFKRHIAGVILTRAISLAWARA